MSLEDNLKSLKHLRLWLDGIPGKEMGAIEGGSGLDFPDAALNAALSNRKSRSVEKAASDIGNWFSRASTSRLADLFSTYGKPPAVEGMTVPDIEVPPRRRAPPTLDPDTPVAKEGASMNDPRKAADPDTAPRESGGNSPEYPTNENMSDLEAARPKHSHSQFLSAASALQSRAAAQGKGPASAPSASAPDQGTGSAPAGDPGQAPAENSGSEPSPYPDHYFTDPADPEEDIEEAVASRVSDQVPGKGDPEPEGGNAREAPADSAPEGMQPPEPLDRDAGPAEGTVSNGDADSPTPDGPPKEDRVSRGRDLFRSTWRDPVAGTISNGGPATPREEPEPEEDRKEVEKKAIKVPPRPHSWPSMMEWPPARDLQALSKKGVTDEARNAYFQAQKKRVREMMARAEEIDAYIREHGRRKRKEAMWPLRGRVIQDKTYSLTEKYADRHKDDPYRGIKWAALLDIQSSSAVSPMVGEWRHNAAITLDGGRLEVNDLDIKIKPARPGLTGVTELSVQLAIREGVARGWETFKMSGTKEFAEMAAKHARAAGIRAEISYGGFPNGIGPKRTITVMPPLPGGPEEEAQSADRVDPGKPLEDDPQLSAFG